MRDTMNIVIWLLAGGLIGWITSKVLKASTANATMRHVVTGVAGGTLSALAIAPVFRESTAYSAEFDWTGFVICIIGALILLVLINGVTGGREQ
jgi:uncharacterized membrane protein YeaQ/YmgE (transglycosylase-associated protein family)